jgi:hypothetical protein
MRTVPWALAALLLARFAAAAPPTPSLAATQWWADIAALAADDKQGRLTGSTGYLRAADYVVQRFKAEGLKPLGTAAYFQAVPLEEQTVDQQASSASLRGPDGSVSLKVGQDSRIAAGGAPLPEAIDAPLVFIGYGLQLPQYGIDDLSGIDLKGKIAVVISGGPKDIPGAVKSNARFSRVAQLGRLGAVGILSLTTPHQLEIPWARQILLASQPGMYLAERELRETPDGFIGLIVDPAKAQTLFEGSGHTFAELCELADASRPLPAFSLPQRLTGQVVARRRPLSSPNLVAVLPGRGPKLRHEYVVVSAHLDHLGVGAPINGASIYHGAMDDASGVAALLDIAHRLKSGTRPRRSVLFVIVTAEEKGLLGSYYFARRPTVPRNRVVADLNFDMPLPLWPLTSVFVPGAGESTLGADARVVADEQGLALAEDPLPDRNVFIRTDQFSFVREGVPSLAFKFGFAKDTPQFAIEHEWRANRYHAPSDDLDQPGIYREEAVKLDAFVAALAARIANTTARPTWLAGSVFKPRSASP